MTDAKPARKKGKSDPKQTLIAKVFHWTNIISLLLMMSSGLQIYNANPVFGGRGGWTFPELLTLGGWLGGGRDWHFAIMWIYAFNLLFYGIYILITRRWKRRFVSTDDLKVIQTGQNPKRKNYAWHRLVYTAIVPLLVIAIFSGLSMYKPASLAWLSGLFGSWHTLRIIHFTTVPIIMLFTLVHSFFALKVGSVRLVKSMFF
jgi:thiosulfate reductase cytochrome b subunit